ncbi:DoxX protein [uncultured Tenacibaculum sp.]|uniref:DoxX protein n=1 Tax=uncultured Tenacibaculum sp. TaxID=174713 RepID=UPI00260E1BFD|nr:DoxX protein [uncultured Tenacibaculum sp.]
MKIVTKITRIFLGIFLLFFGLNGFFHFLPQPEMSAEAGTFLEALASSGYIFPIVGLLEVVVGLLLIVNKFTALALVVIFPILINAFLFHVFLDIPGIGGALIALSLNLFLLIGYKENYKEIFRTDSL